MPRFWLFFLVLSGIVFASGCGGGTKDSVTVPTSVVNEASVPVATATATNPAVTATAVATPTPVATAKPTVTMDQPTLTLLSRVDTLPISEDGKTEIRNNLLGKTIADPKLVYYRYAAAMGTGLAVYYAKPSPDLYRWLKDLKDYAEKTFPKEYENDRQAGLRNGLDPWEIKEKAY